MASGNLVGSKASLILPRVEVIWGDTNLTSPRASEGQDNFTATLRGLGPLVYDVRVSMEDQGQTPTGSMKWNPFGPAYELYERCLKNFIDYSIMVTFYYVTGKSITFEFYWGGQTETYGKEMEINVKMVSLLDGLMNATFYASIQADKEEKGKSHKDSVGELEKQFGIQGLNLIRYTNQAAKDTSESIVKTTYTDGSTFMDAVQNLVKDNGNYVFFNNIKTANAVVFTPYSHEERPGVEPIVILPSPTLANPDPAKRYGYFIGPGIIQSFTRNFEWQPPQKSQEISAILARKAEIEKDGKRKLRDAKNTPDKGEEKARSQAPSGSGVYQHKTSANIMSTNNENGPKKQDIFTEERAAKLSLTTLMCPSLTGLKPLDIIFIPTYSGDYLEDWIVTSVEYQQTQGGVDLAIQATRTLNDSSPMSPVSSQTWQGYAESFGLIPKKEEASTSGIQRNDVLINWTAYAWGSYLGSDITRSAPATGSQPSAVSDAGAQPPTTGTSTSLQGLPPEQQREFTNYVNTINNTYVGGDPNTAVKPFTPEPVTGAPQVAVNDPVFFRYASTYWAGQGLKFKIGSGVNPTEVITGLTPSEAKQLYTNNYLPNRTNFLLDLYQNGALQKTFPFN